MDKKILLLAGLAGVWWWWNESQKDENYLLEVNDKVNPLQSGFEKVSNLISGKPQPNKDKKASIAYIRRLKFYENSRKAGYRNGRWYVHLDSIKKPTVAYGHLVLAGEDFSNGLSEAGAEALLIRDVEKHSGLARQVAVPLTQGQFDACVDFSYNAYTTFRKKIKPIMDAGDLTAGFQAMVNHYVAILATPKYKDSPGLIPRSRFQQNMAGRGVYE